MFWRAGAKVQSVVHKEDVAQESAEAHWRGSGTLSGKSVESL